MSSLQWTEGLMKELPIKRGQIFQFVPRTERYKFIYRKVELDAPIDFSNLRFIAQIDARNPEYRAPLVGVSHLVCIEIDLSRRSTTAICHFRTMKHIEAKVKIKIEYRVQNPHSVLKYDKVIESLHDECQQAINRFTEKMEHHQIYRDVIETNATHAQVEHLGLAILRISVTGAIEWPTDLTQPIATNVFKSVKSQEERAAIEIDIANQRHELYQRLSMLRALGITDPDTLLEVMATHIPDLKIVWDRNRRENKEQQERWQQSLKILNEWINKNRVDQDEVAGLVEDLVDSVKRNMKGSNQVSPILDNHNAFNPENLLDTPQRPQFPVSNTHSLPPSKPPHLEPGKAYLMSISDNSYYLLETQLTTLGRHRENQIVLAGDSSVSRHHAEIAQNNGSYYIKDRGSSFGTYLNGHRLQGQANYVNLNSGDEIQLGEKIVLRFIMHYADHYTTNSDDITRLDPR